MHLHLQPLLSTFHIILLVFILYKHQFKDLRNESSITFFLSVFFLEVPRLGIESELYLLTYTIATTTPNPSHICDLCHSSWGNAGSLTHWARPGIQPAFSWIMVDSFLLSHDRNSKYHFQVMKITYLDIPSLQQTK